MMNKPVQWLTKGGKTRWQPVRDDGYRLSMVAAMGSGAVIWRHPKESLNSPRTYWWKWVATLRGWLGSVYRRFSEKRELQYPPELPTQLINDSSAQTTEVTLERTYPKCSHGFDGPHTIGGETNFHYDHPVGCDEWAVKNGLYQNWLKRDCSHKWEPHPFNSNAEICQRCGQTEKL